MKQRELIEKRSWWIVKELHPNGLRRLDGLEFQDKKGGEILSAYLDWKRDYHFYKFKLGAEINLHGLEPYMSWDNEPFLTVEEENLYIRFKDDEKILLAENRKLNKGDKRFLSRKLL